jgi:molybdopterin converting factor small subunit
MSITVEFFGIPRLRAGVASVTIEADTVNEALHNVSQLLPDWAEHCLEEGNLKPEYLMNINGVQFCKDENEKMESGDSLLIFSADVGG